MFKGKKLVLISGQIFIHILARLLLLSEKGMKNIFMLGVAMRIMHLE